MLSKKQLITIFAPALLVVAIGIFIGIAQYDPLYPKETKKDSEISGAVIPILPEDPILGSKKAPITIIAFEDLACDGCAHQSSILSDVLVKHEGKVKIIWKALNVTRFPISSQLAHSHAICANEQGKFKEFEKLAFANKENLTEGILELIGEEAKLSKRKMEKCLSSGRTEIYRQQTETIATLLNIQAVPAFFINNKQIKTPQSLEEWEFTLGL